MEIILKNMTFFFKCYLEGGSVSPVFGTLLGDNFEGVNYTCSIRSTFEGKIKNLRN